jgi:hypothetical protein
VKQARSLLVVIPDKDKKHIKLHPDVHKELGELVEYKGETYNDIVKRLIKFYKEQKGRK